MPDKLFSPDQVLRQLKHFYHEGVIRALDYQFACFLAEQLPDQTDYDDDRAGTVILLGALVSHQLGAGHSCVNLSSLPENLFGVVSSVHGQGLIALPTSETLIEYLKTSPLVCHEPSPNDDSAYKESADKEGTYKESADKDVQPQTQNNIAPLRLEGSKLYLYRYWRYEYDVANHLKCLLSNRLPPASSSSTSEQAVHEALERLFPHDDNPWPRVAASLALKNHLLIISGGPGTGKTTTVTRTLALLLEQAAAENKKLHIQLAAPTGKAAARLSESIASAKSQLNVNETLRESIPDQAKTLHRLLGVIPNSSSFRFNRQNRLHLDLLLVDEASMIDLPMMNALLSALPDHARLILLGDKDQLASVEPGSVLAELCAHGHNVFSPHAAEYIKAMAGVQPEVDAEKTETALANSICQLQKSYRFHKDSAIGNFARRVNAGDPKVVDAYWQHDTASSDVSLFPLSEVEQHLEFACDRYAQFIKACQQGQQQANERLAEFSNFQILCATREGALSVAEINEWVENRLHQTGVINKYDWYVGCPIMISQNSYRHQLFNGDIGVCLEALDGSKQKRVYFPPIDVTQDPTPRSFLPSRLPPFEKVYATTVHKSQGSEYDDVLMVYPPKDAPILTRELLYTGVTRAKGRCVLLGEKAVLRASVKRKTWRDSGLGGRLC